MSTILKNCINTILFTLVVMLMLSCNQSGQLNEKVALKTTKMLVFSKTKGFRHESIRAGATALYNLGKENGIAVDTTEDASWFTEQRLSEYSVVVFLNTTQNVLNADQQVAFERYIQAGGGYVGIHAAADTEYEWPWYNNLVGAYFASHPHQQNADIIISDSTHPSTKHLPKVWNRFDEWYNYKSLYAGIKVIASLDENSYEGGDMGDKHPTAWYHEYDGGKAFYTGGGHGNESFSDEAFLKHLLGGIQSVMAKDYLDYSKSYSVKAPEDNRFTKTVLANDLNEPMELIVAEDGRVFYTERAGKFYMYDPTTNKSKLLRDFPAKGVDKFLNGLIGVTLDPDFKNNNHLYVFYSSSTKDQLHQNISRFTMKGNELDTTSEKIIIQVPIEAEVSAHTGGSLAWDKDGNLFISTGDNTVPFGSDGYSPIDEGKDRITFDAQRSSANTNDLRGKILRIHPEPDGSYTIPEGNLFPKGTANTRPEIYVMGCRNPYRISVDMETSIVYWGEVGPDAGIDSDHGPRGYDEFNQAKKAGNYGWPYFVGNNKAYHDSNFTTKAVGALFDVNGPINESPNNTGLKKLPPPTSAMIWYPYAGSTEFPKLGNGGRCAMGGPVYHYNKKLKNENRLPEYYDKALFIYDWMRNWVFAVRLDDQQNYKRMESFMQTNGDFRRPVDMEIGPDGRMYVLEYGSIYGIDNEDARLVRIDYNGGNRAPEAVISTTDTIGAAPYEVNLSASKSRDLDEDEISYTWTINNMKISNETKLKHTFDKNGTYHVVLKVTDENGLSNTDTINIKVGNTPPQVDIETSNNKTFFFEKPLALNYKVSIQDKEDKVIDSSKLKVTVNYIPKIVGTGAVMGHQQIDENFNLGKALITGSDCNTCHQTNAVSVGPSYVAIAERYAGDKTAVSKLANKIITGGSGNWTNDRAMSAHPQLSREDAAEMVKYILSLNAKKEAQMLPASGTINLKDHVGQPATGRYFITATYTDEGADASPLSTKKTIILRPATLQAEEADKKYNPQSEWNGITHLKHRSYLRYNSIDLTGLRSMSAYLGAEAANMKLSVRIDSLKGSEIALINIPNTGNHYKLSQIQVPLTHDGGQHDIFFIVLGGDGKQVGIDWMRVQ